MLTPTDLASVSARELAALYEKHGPGLSETLLSQTRVALHLLHKAERAFQPRDKLERAALKRMHIKTLAKAIKQRGKLDPIVVLPIDGTRIIVDGHCRLEAYREAGLRETHRVPVRHLRGTFADALKLAATRNSKENLPWTPAERRNAAWTMTCSNAAYQYGWTVREIADMTGIAKSVVGRMNTTLKELSQNPAMDPSSLTWKEAQRHGKPEEQYDEDWEEKKLRELEEKIGNALGPLPVQQPGLFKDAFLNLYPFMLVVFGEEYVNSEDIELQPETPSDF